MKYDDQPCVICRQLTPVGDPGRQPLCQPCRKNGAVGLRKLDEAVLAVLRPMRGRPA